MGEIVQVELVKVGDSLNMGNEGLWILILTLELAALTSQ